MDKKLWLSGRTDLCGEHSARARLLTQEEARQELARDDSKLSDLLPGTFEKFEARIQNGIGNASYQRVWGEDSPNLSSDDLYGEVGLWLCVDGNVVLNTLETDPETEEDED